MVFKIVAISGSLSKHSANSGLIKACILVNNPQVQIEVLDISSFPLFNMDPIVQFGYPPEVQLVRQKLTTADGIIFASPNHYDKVSAAFKNAYDWISFTQNPQMPSPIREKPAAFMVCSLGDGHKTVQHFRRVCQYCKIKVMEKCLILKKDPNDFDQKGNVKSQKCMHQVQQFVKNYVNFLKDIYHK